VFFLKASTNLGNLIFQKCSWFMFAVSSTQKAIKITLGYHEIEGTLTALKKPVVLLRSRFATSDEQASAMQTSDDPEELKVCEGFDIVGVVRKKFMFKHRPKALISKPEATKKMRTATNFFSK
jgi:chromosome transmission fidelity protein 8